jgi:hypothetical protein
VNAPDPDARLYCWADLLLMWQVGRSFGLAEGFRAYGELVDLAVADALQRPEGAGGPNLDDTTRARACDLYRRYLMGRPS